MEFQKISNFTSRITNFLKRNLIWVIGAIIFLLTCVLANFVYREYFFEKNSKKSLIKSLKKSEIQIDKKIKNAQKIKNLYEDSIKIVKNEILLREKKVVELEKFLIKLKNKKNEKIIYIDRISVDSNLSLLSKYLSKEDSIK